MKFYNDDNEEDEFTEEEITLAKGFCDACDKGIPTAYNEEEYDIIISNLMFSQKGDYLKKAIEKDKKELGEDFCRGCGYCMPCSEDINISMCARMSLWIRRFPAEPYLTEEYQEIMEKTLDCTECYSCVDNCPYELEIPRLLKENYEDYQNVLNGKTKGVRNETMH